ncbi:hypothetical protein PVK06_001495 [Gossypium arboreum]|uniref:Uncharacterized protein n=1 Tax=Gossypium arboreum TaxID=29729 RepID=A0ABR0R1B8_GOSAR|nr:hypothetical protein PVK06_001495 [Gossypium arboreum]
MPLKMRALAALLVDLHLNSSNSHGSSPLSIHFPLRSSFTRQQEFRSIRHGRRNEAFRDRILQSMAALELEEEKQVKGAEITMQQAEDYFDSVMETAMDEFR